MSDIEWQLQEDDIEWTYNLNKEKSPEQIFEKEKALALMLINDVLFTNSHWFEKELPDEFKKSIAVFVNCNDIFAWGCADAEDLPFSEIENLYRLWRKYPNWGAALWCMKQRRKLPQRAVEEAMRNDGIDIDAFTKEHNLKINYYSGYSHVIAEKKYSLYSEWAISQNKEVLPFDKHWWNGWLEYVKEVPEAEKLINYDKLREKFIKDNNLEE